MSTQSLDSIVDAARGKMEYVRLGTSGLQVSKICLGMMSYGDKKLMDWALEEDDALPLIKAAYDAGINFFDTANVYSMGVSEEITGKAVRKFNMNRDELVIATKLFGTVARNGEKTHGLDKQTLNKRRYANQQGLSRKHIFESVEHSLRRLNMDYIDLLQIHRFDPDTSIVETMRALHDIVQTGKVRYIGASSMYAHQFVEMQMTARQHGWTEFITMQNFYAASYREEEREMLPACIRMGVASIPWSPLGGGVIARPVGGQGVTSRGQDRKLDPVEEKVARAVEAVAKRHGIPMAQIALAWCFRHPAVYSPIVGISNPRSLDDALKSIHVKLSDEDVKEIEGAYSARPISGHS